ncbi:MAG: LptF/LptG family permease [Desulfurella sp.]|uniref:LptF/LptG family permease n=1 Tax=Desulfurella sp. TaxID=1962857 RepID=UPI003CADC627
MKLIYSYIAKRFIKIFLLVFVIALSLFYVIDFFNNLSTLISNNVKFSFVLYYYLSYTPKMVYILLPFVFSISTLISLGYMAYTNEILAMKNSGVSAFKIAIPVSGIAIFLVLFMIVLDNFIVPYSYDNALLVREIYIENKNQNLWAKEGNVFVNINSIFYNQKIASDVKVYFTSDNGIREVAIAQLAKLSNSGLVLEKPTIIKIEHDSIKLLSQNNLFLKDFSFFSLVKGLEYQTPNIIELYKKSISFERNRFLYISEIVFKIVYALSIIAILPCLLFMSMSISARKDDFVRKVFLGTLYSLGFLGILMLFNAMAQSKIINPIFPISSVLVIWFLYFLKKVLEY